MNGQTPPSLVQFAAQQQTADGQPLFWGRTEDFYDLPFQGQPPEGTALQLADKIVVKQVYRARFFDTAVPEEMAEYVEIRNKIAAGWWTLRHITLFQGGSSRHYMEYSERYSVVDPRLAAG